MGDTGDSGPPFVFTIEDSNLIITITSGVTGLTFHDDLVGVIVEGKSFQWVITNSNSAYDDGFKTTIVRRGPKNLNLDVECTTGEGKFSFELYSVDNTEGSQEGNTMVVCNDPTTLDGDNRGPPTACIVPMHKVKYGIPIIEGEYVLRIRTTCTTDGADVTASYRLVVDDSGDIKEFEALE